MPEHETETAAPTPETIDVEATSRPAPPPAPAPAPAPPPPPIAQPAQPAPAPIPFVREGERFVHRGAKAQAAVDKVLKQVTPLYKPGACLRTPGNMTGLVCFHRVGFGEVLEYFEPFAEAAGAESVQEFLRARHLVHGRSVNRPTKDTDVFYFLLVATRPLYPFVVGQVDAQLIRQGQGVSPKEEWEIPEPEEPELELKD